MTLSLIFFHLLGDFKKDDWRIGLVVVCLVKTAYSSIWSSCSSEMSSIFLAPFTAPLAFLDGISIDWVKLIIITLRWAGFILK